MGVLEKVRRWVDGESAETVLEEAARNAQVKPRSKAEEFIVEIARKVEAVMQQEIVPLPQGTTLIPTEYVVFLSEEDDKEWQGAKRRGLEQGLYFILAERAREIAGKKNLETKSFAIELRMDGTLESGEIVVEHSWEDEQIDGNTEVFVRPKLDDIDATLDRGTSPSYSPPTPDFTDSKLAESAADATPLVGDTEEQTMVSARGATLCYIEIWKDERLVKSLPIGKSEIVFGRGSKSKPVDVELLGDPEISRRHLVLSIDSNRNFSMINEGRNPAKIDGSELPTGRQISVTPGERIEICSYSIRILAV